MHNLQHKKPLCAQRPLRCRGRVPVRAVVQGVPLLPGVKVPYIDATLVVSGGKEAASREGCHAEDVIFVALKRLVLLHDVLRWAALALVRGGHRWSCRGEHHRCAGRAKSAPPQHPAARLHNSEHQPAIRWHSSPTKSPDSPVIVGMNSRNVQPRPAGACTLTRPHLRPHPLSQHSPRERLHHAWAISLRHTPRQHPAIQKRSGSSPPRRYTPGSASHQARMQQWSLP